jgi:hypothetical protein
MDHPRKMPIHCSFSPTFKRKYELLTGPGEIVALSLSID